MQLAPETECWRFAVPVSIPQAVSTVATFEGLIDFVSKDEVSIPQAVSTVATKGVSEDGVKLAFGFQYRKR